MKKAPKTVTAYIASAPEDTRGKLKQLRAAIKQTAPKAVEKISYGMPYYSYNGRLAYFALAKTHIGLYALLEAFELHKREVKKYRTGRATLQFPLDQKLPLALIKKLVKTQLKLNEAKKRARY
jgi:uncharacterized protein YdhG (YjbR/CyaY superfamily)